LDLSNRILAEGFGLKDATPYNVLFQGTRPVFVDLLSFERRRQGDVVWLPYAQFVRTFVLPLHWLYSLKLSLSRVFVANREGLEPEELYKLLRPVERLKARFFPLVTLPTWLGRSKGLSKSIVYRRELKDLEKADYILRSLFRRLEKSLKCTQPRRLGHSRWSGYENANHYRPEAASAKRDFVQRVFQEIKPERVLDVGANSGSFSELAARAGAKVVAIDSDPVVVGALWRRAAAEKLDILPLIVDIANPSPAVGWRNGECLSFLERARGNFDCVLLLALVHHLMVAERILLSEILDLAAYLSTHWVVIEFVGQEDPMFRSLLRGRDELHRNLDQISFEEACKERFDIAQSIHLPLTQRWIYLLKKK
jgi:SAM-dependent methyltransferase